MVIVIILLLPILYILCKLHYYHVLCSKVESWLNTVCVYLNKRYALLYDVCKVVHSIRGHDTELFETLQIAKYGVDMQSIKDAYSNQAVVYRQVLAVGSAYPDVNASDDYKHLVTELRNAEANCNTSKDLYNESVIELLQFVSRFPMRLFKLKVPEMLDTDDTQNNT